jgi:hypothetical protein
LAVSLSSCFYLFGTASSGTKKLKNHYFIDLNHKFNKFHAMSDSINDINDIYENGEYCNPACEHFKISNVSCRRCPASNLEMCIGYEGMALCLECIHELSTKSIVKPKRSSSEPRMTKPIQFRQTSSPQLQTKMMQSQLR